MTYGILHTRDKPLSPQFELHPIQPLFFQRHDIAKLGGQSAPCKLATTTTAHTRHYHVINNTLNNLRLRRRPCADNVATIEQFIEQWSRRYSLAQYSIDNSSKFIARANNAAYVCRTHKMISTTLHSLQIADSRTHNRY